MFRTKAVDETAPRVM